MINRLQLIRNISQFDSVDSAATIQLARLTLIYAENGRGKTTIAAILRSLATGDPVHISERRRLNSQHPPHVVLDCDGGPPPVIFNKNAWNRTLPNMAIFDDSFIDQNVCSGLEVGPGHRQNLHELILGAQGVTLNRQFQSLVTQIEGHNASLRSKAAAIPAVERGHLSVDEFCMLPDCPNIDAAIQDAERALAAAREQDRIHSTSPFEILSLPSFDLEEIEQVLQQDLPGLDAAAVVQVQSHIGRLGPNGETWIADGVPRVVQISEGKSVTCPFCAQYITGSPIIDHYRAYFSNSYVELKRLIAERVATINQTHGGAMIAAFERAIRVAGERRQFWSQFCDIPDITIDTALIVRIWQEAREAISKLITLKQSSPLDPVTISDQVRAALAAYESQRQTISFLSERLQQANIAISIVKEKAASSDPQVLSADLKRLMAIKARHQRPIADICADYLAEKEAKMNTERLREQTKAALAQYRTSIFPSYESAINRYLGRFNAGFRLDAVNSANTRGGPVCTYDVIINDIPVSVLSATPAQGEPSFRNTLSAGDRNTLALAFFFASLEQDAQLTDKIVVIDDPMSSLDEHRTLATVQEVRRLAERAGQVVVLSHNRPFLCRIWEGADRTTRVALQVVRNGTKSVIQSWDVDQDSITEHDRRHAMLRGYISSGSRHNDREVARAIRPLIEAFLRVACPEHFPPGMLLGPFRHLCTKNLNTGQEILGQDHVRELRDLIEYANRFHHDTNPAWETEIINDAELMDFVRRALNFTRR